MWLTLFLGLLVASVVGWVTTAYLQVRRIRRLERSQRKSRSRKRSSSISCTVWARLSGKRFDLRNCIGLSSTAPRALWMRRGAPFI